MSAITEFLFPAPAKRSAGSIIGWWERRRLPYNLAVGAAGVVSLAFSTILVALPPNGQLLGALPPWQPILVFGVMANICYLLGPTVEIVVDKLWGREVLPTGPALYRMGLTFSVGLALFPALLMVIFWVARIVMAIV
jgi:hypothetical protein